MATYYFTNSSDTTIPDGALKVVSGGSHTLHDGDVVIISDNYSGGNVTFKSASTSGTANVTITTEAGTNSNNFAVSTADNGGGKLAATVNVPDGASYTGMNFSAGSDAPNTVNIGDADGDGTGAKFGSVFINKNVATVNVSDQSIVRDVSAGGATTADLNFGDDTKILGRIDGSAGNDAITFGDNVTVGDFIGSQNGNDTIKIGHGFKGDTLNAGWGNGDVLRVPQGEYYYFRGSTKIYITDDTRGSDISGKTVFFDDENGNCHKAFGGGYGFECVEPPCFTRGTLILTANGEVAVEDLGAGDLVVTRDNGLQPIRWIGSKALDSATVAEAANLRPIRIRRGALGADTPSADLLVSPQHRILVRSKIARTMFGADEVLVAAKHLCVLDGIDVATDLAEVEYFHLLFDRHEVLISNGAESESLYTGPQTLKTVGPQALEEIFGLFPELRDHEYEAPSARPLTTGRMGRKLAIRHKNKARALVD